MKPVITPEESARLDALADVPVDVLMDRAGFAVAVKAAALGAGYGTRTVVLCGPGNNGGDGYVAARYLAKRGGRVEVLAAGYPKGDSSPARRAAVAAADAGVSVTPIGQPRPADLVIDALFGAGFHGTLPPHLAGWARAGQPVLAVDLPSGVDGGDGSVAGDAFVAMHTVTFGALKGGHVLGAGPDHCGEVTVVDIGLPDPDPAYLLCEDGDAPRPARARTAHKWSSGSVAVAGGSVGIGGAAMLAARAALAFGAGAVRLIAPGALQGAYAAMDPAIMTTGVGTGDRFDAAEVSGLLAAAARFDVLVLGPGMGPDQEKVAAAMLEGWDKAMVIDADGINAITPDRLAARPAPTVVTPHAGELARLAGEPASPSAAQRLARATGTVVVLKGNPTIVAGEEAWIVASGGSELATIGTGDVLAGMLGALIGRGLEPEEAARSAAHWHGRAGAALAARTSVTANGLIDEIGRWAW